MMQFQKATKAKSKARIAFIAPSGGGKTYSALAVGTVLAGPKGKMAVIDTERGSASKYADEFSFDVLELESFSPDSYVEAITLAYKAGYDVLVIDSLSHAWMGKDGALEMVDEASKRTQSGNKFMAWRDVTPKHNRMVDAIVRVPMHVIVTMRSKTEYVVETNERGKQVPKKVGTAPIQRDGLEYEFDVVGDLDLDHNYIISKTRCRALDGKVIEKPGKQFGETIVKWLSDGVDKPTTSQSLNADPADLFASEVGATVKQYPITVNVPTEQWLTFYTDPAIANIAGTPPDEMKVAKAVDKLGFVELTPDNITAVHARLVEYAATIKPAAAPANGTHWSLNDDERKKFWGTVNAMKIQGVGITKEQVHEALDCQHLADLAVDRATAVAKVAAWVSAKNARK